MTIDDEAQKFIATRWIATETMNKEGNPENLRERLWEDGERHNAEVNAKVLKVIFDTVNPSLKEHISNYSEGKDAWYLLQSAGHGKNVTPPSSKNL